MLNRPIQIGVTILEVSKLIMYTYYFDVLKISFGSRIKLLYTDTDSYIVEWSSRTLLDDLKSIQSALDTSNIPSKKHYLSELYSSENTADLFYFKSEVGGDDTLAFVGVRAKVYSLIRTSSKHGTQILEIISKLKGVNIASVGLIGKNHYKNRTKFIFI